MSGRSGSATQLGDADEIEFPRSDRIADQATALIGSWRFIPIRVALLALWMILNPVAWLRHWDPYPFIFLNLVLSFKGDLAAPIVLMSQNRQRERDRIT
jgi:uncharacterized membrane protein